MYSMEGEMRPRIFSLVCAATILIGWTPLCASEDPARDMRECLYLLGKFEGFTAGADIGGTQPAIEIAETVAAIEKSCEKIGLVFEVVAVSQSMRQREKTYPVCTNDFEPYDDDRCFFKPRRGVKKIPESQRPLSKKISCANYLVIVYAQLSLKKGGIVAAIRRGAHIESLEKVCAKAGMKKELLRAKAKILLFENGRPSCTSSTPRYGKDVCVMR